ncbi:MAG: hypothetical protein JRI52_01205 [Deltaproteobacteria bacterium]|nr:hypothetical protein [Deltaproteobacteria bacterium]
MRDDEEAIMRILTTSCAKITNLLQQYRDRVVDAPKNNSKQPYIVTLFP